MSLVCDIYMYVQHLCVCLDVAGYQELGHINLIYGGAI